MSTRQPLSTPKTQKPTPPHDGIHPPSGNSELPPNPVGSQGGGSQPGAATPDPESITGRFIIDGHSSKSGETNRRKWTLHTIELISESGGIIYAKTFSNTLGSVAENHHQQPCTAKVRRDGQYGYFLEAIEIEDETPPA